MKNLFLILVQTIWFTAALAQHQGHNMPAQKQSNRQAQKVIYTCVMHPEVKMDKPGNCPKCGMTLIKKKIKVSAPKPAPQKNEDKSKQKETQSAQKEEPKEMNMGMHQHEQPKEEQPAQKVIYTCVMHPEVKIDKPGNCPKCGMTLIKKKIKVSAPKSGEKTEQEDMNMDMNKHDQHKEDNKTDESIADVFPAGKVNMVPGKTVHYDLYITDTFVNYTGKLKHAYAINGTIPGPNLVFTEGDTAEIYLHNRLKNEETSLHWHGVILPNRFDGVPYLTTERIGPGETHLYKFAIVQNGTYWYHSHSQLQEQAGIYGALIFKNREEQKMAAIPLPAGKLMEGHEGHDMKKMDMPGTQNHEGHESMTPDMPGMQQQEGHQMQDMAAQKIKMVDGTFNAEHTVVLSEWTDEKPEQVQRRLRTANDWYAIQKGSVQSYAEAIKAGHFKTKVINEWKRMNAMDVSDVYYDRFLTNGRPEISAPQFKAGDRVKLRVVNAGASSYFWLQYGGGKMTVVANDGNDVEPVEADRLIIGVAETYDVVVTIPRNMSYEFRATPEDRTKATSLWLGSGMKMPAPVLPRLKYFEGMKMMNAMMKMNGDMKMMDMQMSLQQMDMNRVMYDELNDSGDGGMQGHQMHNMNDMDMKKDDQSMQKDSVAKNTPAMEDHNQHNKTNVNAEKADSAEAMNMIEMQGMNMGNSDIVTLNYAMLRSPEKTILPAVPYKELHFTLTGNMNRYVWSINNKIVREWDKILIEKGQNVRIIMFNNSMMRHPMHLHGHDFRVLNGQGEYAPLKNVLDIMPMETDTIEFAANQSGDWFFHCHILYHMMAGMGNVFSYKNSPVNPELPDPSAAYRKFIRDMKMIHPMAEIGLESNGSDGMFMLSGERYELRSEWRIGIKPHHGYESETYIGRYLGKMQWLFPFIGFDYHKNNRENNLEKNAFGQLSNQNNRKAFVAGVEYVLPMLVRAQARADSDGKFRFQLSREDIPLTSRLRLNFMWNTDKEYMGGFRYIVRKWLAFSTHYDSDMGYGAGITLTY